MSNQVKHTPGPWGTATVLAEKGEILKIRVSADDGKTGYQYTGIADVFSLDDEGKANAKLIAAAPELLEAAIEIIKGAQNSDGTISKTTSSIALQKLQKAIAKAEGK